MGRILSRYHVAFTPLVEGGTLLLIIASFSLIPIRWTVPSSSISGYGWNTPLDQSGHNATSTYPNASFGMRVGQKLYTASNTSIQFAVLDGVPENSEHPRENAINFSHENGLLLASEADYHPSDNTKLLLGYWRYTARSNDRVAINANGNPRQDNNNQGIGEHLLCDMPSRYNLPLNFPILTVT